MMDAKFVFDRVRLGTQYKNQIAIRGYCTDKYNAETKFKAKLTSKNQTAELECHAILSPVSMLERVNVLSSDMTQTITFLVDVPNEIGNNSELSIIVSNESITNTLWKCKGSRIKFYMNMVNVLIDSVVTLPDMIMIKGRAIDLDDISFSVIDKHKQILSNNDLSIKNISRADTEYDFPENTGENMVSFSISCKRSDEQLYLMALAGKRESMVKLNIQSNKTSNKIKHYAGRFFETIHDEGLKVAILKVRRNIKAKRSKKPKEYSKWIATRMAGKNELDKQRKREFVYNPKFSILVPLYETNQKYLDELIQSIKNQTYSNWEICFSDGSRDVTRLNGIIDRYISDDNRIKYIADLKTPLGIAENTNQAMTIATGDYIVLGDHDDLFTPDALYECVNVLNKKRVDVIYTDEDKIDENSKMYFGPNFKPDYNIDLLRSNNYICHMFVASNELVDLVGGFNKSFDGAQDYDFILRCVERAVDVYHIPKVLYHWRAHKGSTADNPESKLYAFEAGKRAIEAHYDRLGIKAEVEELPEHGFYKTTYDIIGEPMISIVIPNKDHISDLKKCMDSVDNLSSYRNYEFVIIENNSTESETFEFYKEIEKKHNVHVVYWDKEFNYSAINNYGVRFSNGEYILLLNNDTEMISPDSLRQMLGYCQREEVGIVGARLYYDDGAIQHAGVVVGYGGIAGHAFVGLYEDDDLYMSRTKVACDYSAVTAACLMTKKSIFNQVNGLDETFKVAFNDIDFCMKVRQLDKLVVYNANATFHHYESKSRGLEDTPEKQQRFRGEIQRFVVKWPDIMRDGDPYYNTNLTLDKADFSIRY